MTSSIAYSIATLTIDGIRSFLQLLDVQNVHKKTSFSLNNIWVGNSVQDGRFAIDYEGLIHIFNLFMF